MAELQWNGKTTGCHANPTEVSPPYDPFTTQHCYQPQELLPPHPQEYTPTWFNRLIYGSNKQVLPALLPQFRNAIDLIYIDPPFMTGRTFRTTQTDEAIAYRDTWKNDLDTYLQQLYETFHLLYQLLAEDGSIYVHLDWRATHYAKIILDEIFGTSPNANGPGFKNEIIWHYQTGGRAKKYFARKHDTILLYTKSAKYCFHGERVGKPRGNSKRNNMRKEISADGRITWTIRSGGRLYSYTEDTLMPLNDVWTDISHLHQKDPERTGYATQKPLALLERILLTSSEEQDLVLDCFCGSGVTACAAEQLGRRWITCDQSEVAIKTAHERLLQTTRRYPFALQNV